MSIAISPPIIGVPADVNSIEDHPFHMAGDKYLAALVEAAGAMPLIIPAFGERLDWSALLDRLDGVMLTGAVSNVEAQRFGGAPADAVGPHDARRDATTLPLIDRVLQAGMPLLAICRGHQELNVALGGSLFQKLHEVAGRFDHRARKHLPRDQQYEPIHPVTLVEGGQLRDIAGGAAEIMVNSLHGQAIDRLADRLIVEAVAADGTIEAVRLRDSATFALGVQWHPEWRVAESGFAAALFGRFGAAARRYAVDRGAARAA